MVVHVRYSEQRYGSARECLEGIRRFLAEGWWLSSLDGPRHGMYVATFGVDDADDGPVG